MPGNYRVGGSASEELKRKVSDLKEQGCEIAIEAKVEPGIHKFGPVSLEFTVSSDDEGVLGLLADNRVHLGQCSDTRAVRRPSKKAG